VVQARVNILARSIRNICALPSLRNRGYRAYGIERIRNSTHHGRCGAVGVVATVGNGFFKPRVLAEQSLRRAENLTAVRRQAEADWDAISSSDSNAAAKRQSVIGRLIISLNQNF
jgi:hypothetical protein